MIGFSGAKKSGYIDMSSIWFVVLDGRELKRFCAIFEAARSGGT